jgi:hypothetical protein
MKQKNESTKVKRALPFKLTDEEKARKAEAAANLNEELEAAVAAKKVEVEKHTVKIKGLTNKISNTLKAIQTGEERKEVQCTEVKNFEKNLVEYVFKGQVLETREMTAEDRQLTLADKPEKKGPKPKWQSMAPKYDPKKTAEQEADEEIAQVHKLETSRKTASSSVDTKL